MDKADILLQWSELSEEPLIQNPLAALAVINADGSLHWTNAMMLELFPEINLDVVINPPIKHVSAAGSKFQELYQGFITIKDGSKADLSIDGKILSKDGQFFIMGMLRLKDIVIKNQSLHQLNSEINNLQRELLKEKRHLEQTLKLLEEANAHKDLLFSIISHDLRGPIGSMDNLLTLLVDSGSMEEHLNRKELFLRLKKTTGQTFTLLQNLLEWSLMQKNEIKFWPQEQRINEVIFKSIDIMRPVANNKKIRILPNVSQNTELLFDEDMIRTVLRNLIGNAIKYSFEESNILIETSLEEQRWVLSVIDFGQGMTPEQAEHVFTLKHKKKSEYGTGGEKGSGLGLLLCKDFVEKHKGQIWLESEKDKGTKISFSLPI